MLLVKIQLVHFPLNLFVLSFTWAASWISFFYFFLCFLKLLLIFVMSPPISTTPSPFKLPFFELSIIWLFHILTVSKSTLTPSAAASSPSSPIFFPLIRLLFFWLLIGEWGILIRVIDRTELYTFMVMMKPFLLFWWFHWFQISNI